MRHTIVAVGGVVVAALLLVCSPSETVDNGGGASEVEVVGMIYHGGNRPASSTQVKLIPSDYDATVMGSLADSMIDTTDSQGNYRFEHVPSGIYNILAVQLAERTRMLITGVAVEGEKTVAPEDTLRVPGHIRMLIPGTALRKGRIWIPGTDIDVQVNNGGNHVVLDSIPAGTLPEIRYTVNDDSLTISRRNVVVNPADTTLLVAALQQYMRKLCLNTSATGADVREDVYGFPVLVRLSSDNFDFSQAKSTGEDILFTASNGNILAFEMELWDAAAGKAAIWVSVDTLFGNNSSQIIVMYWGNAAAAGLSKSTSVFDTAAGFQGVWHLAEGGNDPALDATVNRYDGSAYRMAGGGTANAGLIGKARSFDGDSSYLRMHNTANGRLSFGQDDYFTVSAWVYAETFDNVYRTILAKGYRQYFLQLSYFPGPGALWQFSVFRQENHWNMSHTAATGGERRWVHLAGVRKGTTQYLYLNGVFIDSTTAVYTHNTATVADSLLRRDTSDDFTIGRFLKEPQYPAAFGACYFKGSIDEARVCSVARSADWIRLCYMNQRGDDKLVQFK